MKYENKEVDIYKYDTFTPQDKPSVEFLRLLRRYVMIRTELNNNAQPRDRRVNNSLDPMFEGLNNEAESYDLENDNGWTFISFALQSFSHIYK